MKQHICIKVDAQSILTRHVPGLWPREGGSYKDPRFIVSRPLPEDGRQYTAARTYSVWPRHRPDLP